MTYHAGIDVSLEQCSICVVDDRGRVYREAKVASEPGALIAWFASLDVEVSRWRPERCRNGFTRG